MRVLLFLLLSILSARAGLEWRGMTVSCQTYGPEWATLQMAETLDHLKTLGCNAFAIHPYAKIEADGRIRFSTDPAPDYIVRPAHWAREKGLTLMLAPHLAYWGSPFSWRGEIQFAKPGEWDRFFADYTQWITGLAVIAETEKIPILCIGLEYSHAVRFPDRWRAIIRQVRAVYHGRLTYGANWNEYRDVTFWDALDFIGILAYFPLTTVGQPDPSEEVLRAGWGRLLTELAAYSQEHRRPILFTEHGYNESDKAAAHPWAYQTGGPNAAAIQERCLAVALSEMENAGFLRGVFLWKWFPKTPDFQVETFDLRPQRLQNVIQKHWQPVSASVP